MKATKLTPMLYTAHWADTITFYTQTLGFLCHEKNDEWGWALLQSGDVEIMVSKPHAHLSFAQPSFTGSLYITVDDVDMLWEKLKDTCTVEYPLETFEWGMREFAIRDNNGYVLQFGQNV